MKLKKYGWNRNFTEGNKGNDGQGTSNIEHRTLNIERKRGMALMIAAISFVLLITLWAAAAMAQETNAISGANVAADNAAAQALATNFVLAWALKYPWVGTVLLTMGTLRVFFKPFMSWIESTVAASPTKAQELKDFESGPAFKVIAWLLDFGASIKLKATAVNTLVSAVVALMFGLGALGLATGCGSGRLEQGGAYAPGITTVVTNANGSFITNFVATGTADLQLEQADAAFALAASAMDAVFKIELENRAYLWKLNPNIKHTLDKLRPQVVAAEAAYGRARIAYQANPGPGTITSLQSGLAEVQALIGAVQAAAPPAVVAPAP
jgi:hypothetical protein